MGAARRARAVTAVDRADAGTLSAGKAGDEAGCGHLPNQAFSVRAVFSHSGTLRSLRPLPCRCK